MGALKTVASALGGAIAVLLVLELRSPGGASVSTSSPPTSPSAVVIDNRGATELAALRREVRASIPSVAVPTMAPSDHDVPDPTAEQVDAAEAAMNVVATAADSGHWTAEDRERLHAVIDRLHPEDREAVLLAWAAAVNEQRLRPDVPMF